MQHPSHWTEPGAFESYLANHSCTIRLIVLLFQFFGLAPISVTKFRLQQQRRAPRRYTPHTLFKKCIYSHVYIYVLMIAICALGFVTVPLISENDSDDSADLLDEFATIKGIFGIMVILLIWVIVGAKPKEALNIVNRLVDVDRELFVLQDLCYLSTSKKQIIVMVSANCTVWILIFIFEILVVPGWYKVWGPLLLPSMIMNWYVMQYVFLLLLIEARIGTVNRAFRMITKGRLAMFIYPNMRPPDTSERKIVNNFLVLRRAHAILHEICQNISDYYSFPVLPTMAFLCCATVYDSYYLMLPLAAPSYYTSRLEIANMICWLIMETSPLIVLALYVSRVLNQMEKTGGIVYNVLSRAVLTTVAKNELIEFSLELLHRKLEFTAYGIISLDGTLIKSMFGMLATYLIILMQFQRNH